MPFGRRSGQTLAPDGGDWVRWNSSDAAISFVRRIRALRRDAALRRGERVFLAEGLHLAARGNGVQRSDRGCDRVAAIDRAPRGSRAGGADRETPVSLPLDLGEDPRLAAGRALRAADPAHRATPRMLSAPGRHRQANAKTLLTVTCSVQDPGNLGAMIRSTDAAGGNGSGRHRTGNGSVSSHERFAPAWGRSFVFPWFTRIWTR